MEFLAGNADCTQKLRSTDEGLLFLSSGVYSCSNLLWALTHQHHFLGLSEITDLNGVKINA